MYQQLKFKITVYQQVINKKAQNLIYANYSLSTVSLLTVSSDKSVSTTEIELTD